jgi:hypothetical protein
VVTYSVKAFMSAATLAPKEASTQSHSEVTADDLANLERVLAKIDLRNFVLGCVSQWLIAWELAREICEDFEASPRTVQENLAQLFRNVIDRTASQGDTILGLALNKSLGIDLDHFKLNTRCTPNDVKACVTVLRDRITQFFAPHDPAFGETILKSIEHESSTIGSSSI